MSVENESEVIILATYPPYRISFSFQRAKKSHVT